MSLERKKWRPIEDMTPEERSAERAELQAIVDQGKLYYPHLFFRPHAGQIRAIKMIADGVADGVQYFVIGCGNGWGKSILEAMMLWSIMAPPEQLNDHFKYPMFQKWPFPKRARLICNAKQLKEMSGAVARTIKEMWPSPNPPDYRAIKQGMEYDSMYTVPSTGWVMDVLTEDQPRKLHESETIGIVCVDETIRQEVFDVYPSRFRKGGIFIMFATLCDENSWWISERLIDNPDCRYTYGDIEENCADHGDGYLAHKDIENAIKHYSPEERESRKTGRPLHLSGRSFPVHDDVHFVLRDSVPSNCTAYGVVDPHDCRPWAMAVGMLDGNRDLYIVDEWPKINDFGGTYFHRVKSDNRGISDYARIINQLTAKWNVYEWVIDSKFASRQTRQANFAINLRKQLAREHGLYFKDGNVHVAGEGGGIRVLQDRLKFDDSKPVDFTNKPKLFVCKDLLNTCHQLKNIVWKNGELLEELLDFPRLIMYLCMHNLKTTEYDSHENQYDLAEHEKVRRAMEQEAEWNPHLRDKIEAMNLMVT